jgi:hypothetical protein
MRLPKTTNGDLQCEGDRAERASRWSPHLALEASMAPMDKDAQPFTHRPYGTIQLRSNLSIRSSGRRLLANRDSFLVRSFLINPMHNVSSRRKFNHSLVLSCYFHEFHAYNDTKCRGKYRSRLKAF